MRLLNDPSTNGLGTETRIVQLKNIGYEVSQSMFISASVSDPSNRFNAIIYPDWICAARLEDDDG